MKLRVGLVGLGPAWETRHRSALRALSERFDVRAICEQVSHRAEQAAREFDAQTTDGYHALVRREDIDAILMLSPQWYGPLPIFAACEAGKAVYYAAASELSLSQADKVRDRVERAGIAFMAEFPRRLAPATLRLKELIATQLGQARLLFCHSRRTYSPTSDPQCAEKNVSSELIELVDWCSYVVGRPPTSVVGARQPSGVGRGGYRMLSLEFVCSPQDPELKPLAQVSCGDYLPDTWPEAKTFRPPAALQVSCERGVAFVDLPASLVWFDEAGRHFESLDAELPVGEQLLAQFHRAVTSLVRSTEELDKAHLALRTVLAGEESGRLGRRIELS
jgi:predicted dehydrogenase